jgi:hypothetical protein
MAFGASGPIAFSNLQTIMGGSNPVSLSEYYRSGSYVYNTGVNAAVPAAGALALSKFYSTSGFPATVFSITSSITYNPCNGVATSNGGADIASNGGTAFGSGLGSYTDVNSSSVPIIAACFFESASGIFSQYDFVLEFTNNVGAFTDANFYSVECDTFGGVPLLRTNGTTHSFLHGYSMKWNMGSSGFLNAGSHTLTIRCKN